MQSRYLQAGFMAYIVVGLVCVHPCLAASHGRVEGILGEDVFPIERQVSLLRIGWLDYGPEVKRHGYDTSSDSQGRFTFENIPTGWYELGYLIRTSGSPSPSLTQTIRRPVHIGADQTLKVTLGAQGRIISGRFVLPPGCTDDIPFNAMAGINAFYTPRTDMVQAQTKPPAYARLSPKEQYEWNQRWYRENEAILDRLRQEHAKDPRRRHYAFMVEDTGRFRIDHVIGGTYTMYVTFEKHPWDKRFPWEQASFTRRFVVPDVKPDSDDTVFDLGDLELTVHPGMTIGQTAPDFNVKALDGQTITLASLRGKTTLLYFWSSWIRGGEQAIERVHSQTQNDPNWVILGMNVNDTLEELQEHLTQDPLDWPVVYLGLKKESQLCQDYCAVTPSYIIIGPQGHIIAADYFGGDRLHKAVDELRARHP